MGGKQPWVQEHDGKKVKGSIIFMGIWGHLFVTSNHQFFPVRAFDCGKKKLDPTYECEKNSAPLT